MLSHAMLCLAVLCYTMLRYVKLCLAESCHAVLMCAKLCYAVPCQDVSCFAQVDGWQPGWWHSMVAVPRVVVWLPYAAPHGSGGATCHQIPTLPSGSCDPDAGAGSPTLQPELRHVVVRVFNGKISPKDSNVIDIEINLVLDSEEEREPRYH